MYVTLGFLHFDKFGHVSLIKGICATTELIPIDMTRKIINFDIINNLLSKIFKNNLIKHQWLTVAIASGSSKIYRNFLEILIPNF